MLRLEAGEANEVTCEARGSRPRAVVRWRVGQREVDEGGGDVSLTHRTENDGVSAVFDMKRDMTHGTNNSKFVL